MDLWRKKPVDGQLAGIRRGIFYNGWFEKEGRERGNYAWRDSNNQQKPKENGGAADEQRTKQRILADFPPDLGRIIAAWPHLSDDTRQAILAMVNAK